MQIVYVETGTSCVVRLIDRLLGFQTNEAKEKGNCKSAARHFIYSRCFPPVWQMQSIEILCRWTKPNCDLRITTRQYKRSSLRVGRQKAQQAK